MNNTNKPETMTKDEMLAHWQELPADMPVRMQQVAYKHEGSTYNEDGIRITGSREFIDSVLSRLKDLLDYEGNETRLQVVYKESTDRETRQPTFGYNCYIQVHERGPQSRAINSAFNIYGRNKKGADRQPALV